MRIETTQTNGQTLEQVCKNQHVTHFVFYYAR